MATKSAQIDELQPLEINGTKQWVLCRGNDRAKPVVLFVHGGPGTPTMMFSRAFDEPLLDDFVVVHWDQRGSGKSYDPAAPLERYVLPQYVDDGIAVAQHLICKFNREKILLVGHSWGTIVASHMVVKSPGSFRGLVLVGTMANVRQTEQHRYEMVRQAIDTAGDSAAAEALKALGAPPFVTHDALGRFGELLTKHVGFGGVFHKLTMDEVAAAALKNREYSEAELEASYAVMKLVLTQMAPQIAGYDAIREVSKIEAPVYLVQGKHDLNTPAQFARAFYDRLECPKGKSWIEFAESAHFPFYEEPQRFRKVLIEASRN